MACVCQKGTPQLKAVGKSPPGPGNNRSFRWSARAQGLSRDRSFDPLQYSSALPWKFLNLSAFLDRYACILPVLQRILVAAWSTRSGRATMHPTTLFSADCRGPAAFAGAGFCPTAWGLASIGSVLRLWLVIYILILFYSIVLCMGLF